MGDVTRILTALDRGTSHAADELLPLVYDELRELAERRMVRERAEHTLQPTALVHEAYVRLVDVEHQQRWRSRGHFFGAAAEAMRRILVEHARRKAGPKRGGGRRRLRLSAVDAAALGRPDELLALDEALQRLEAEDPLATRVVSLRYFAGLTMAATAEALGISLRTAERNWTYARSWLHRALVRDEEEPRET